MHVVILQDGNTTSAENIVNSLEEGIELAWNLAQAREDYKELPEPQLVLWENNGYTDERALTTGNGPDEYTYFILSLSTKRH